MAGAASPMGVGGGSEACSGSLCVVGCATLSRGFSEKDGLGGATGSIGAGGVTGDSTGALARSSLGRSFSRAGADSPVGLPAVSDAAGGFALGAGVEISSSGLGRGLSRRGGGGSSSLMMKVNRRLPQSAKLKKIHSRSPRSLTTFSRSIYEAEVIALSVPSLADRGVLDGL